MRSIEKILEESGAVLTGGHFVYTSGFHGDAYVNKDAVYRDTFFMKEIGELIAARCPHPDVVLGPAVGGALLAQWVAYAFSREDMMSRHIVPAVYADKDGDGFVVKRGYDKLIAGKKVLVVEDILNTGDSVRKTIEAVRYRQGEVIGVGAICNRGGVTREDLGVPTLYALLSINMATYDPDKCPLCRDQVPVNVDVGHGRTFVASLASIDAERGGHPLPG